MEAQLTRREKERLVKVGSNLAMGLSSIGASWCLCFGTLLGVIRDKKIIGDIDIGILDNHANVYSALKSIMTLVQCVVDDTTGMPYQAAFRMGDEILDVYFWYRRGGYAYHCYDESVVRPQNGVLPEYHFKGIPEDIFWPKDTALRCVSSACKIGRHINTDNTYRIPVPGIPNEGVYVHIPFGFGQALDHWYPGLWYIPDAQYGVSKAAHEFRVTTCKGIGWRP